MAQTIHNYVGDVILQTNSPLFLWSSPIIPSTVVESQASSDGQAESVDGYVSADWSTVNISVSGIVHL